MIVSKDSDMHQRSFVFGYPPKIVWVRLGNCSTSDDEGLLRGNLAAIKEFYEDDYASFLGLFIREGELSALDSVITSNEPRDCFRIGNVLLRQDPLRE